jgi:hypothetical protein
MVKAIGQHQQLNWQKRSNFFNENCFCIVAVYMDYLISAE